MENKKCVDGIWYQLYKETKEAFVECSDIKGDKYIGNITLPTSVNLDGEEYKVTRIGSKSFSNCKEFQSIIIPMSVVAIGYSAFSGCSNLTAIILPESVTNIEMGAFHNCSNLTSIAIPKNVVKIGWRAFYGCTNLHDIEKLPGMKNKMRE